MKQPQGNSNFTSKTGGRPNTANPHYPIISRTLGDSY